MYYRNQFYGYPTNGYRNEQVTDLIIEAMHDERSDNTKYKMMMDVTESNKIRDQIKFAYEDEGKHYKLFQNIYQQLTGQYIEIPRPKIELSDNFVDDIESSINGELKAVELYRKIMSMLPTQQMRDTLFEIITDEQEHATRFVYLYSMLK